MIHITEQPTTKSTSLKTCKSPKRKQGRRMIRLGMKAESTSPSPPAGSTARPHRGSERPDSPAQPRCDDRQSWGRCVGAWRSRQRGILTSLETRLRSLCKSRKVFLPREKSPTVAACPPVKPARTSGAGCYPRNSSTRFNFFRSARKPRPLASHHAAESLLSS